MSNTGWIYPVEVREEGGQFHAYTSAAPEAIAAGDTVETACEEMREALKASVRGRMKRGMALPLPGEATEAERYRVALPARLATKAALYVAWQESGLTKTALAERLGRGEAEVRRILDPDYGTKLDQLEEAAIALGHRLTIGLERAA